MTQKNRQKQVFGDIEVDGDAQIGGDQTITGNQTVTGTLGVTGDATFPTSLPSATGSSSGEALAAATDVALTSDVLRYVRVARLTLTDLVVSVTAALDYGGTKVCDLPDSNILILGAEVNLSLDKDGTGIVAATDMTMGLGTAVASNATLSGAMIDLLTLALTVDEDPTTWAQHTHDLAAPALTFADDAAAGALFLNAAATLTVDGTLTVTGTIDIYYIDTGNVTS